MLQPDATTVLGFVEFREGVCLMKDGTYILKEKQSGFLPFGK